MALNIINYSDFLRILNNANSREKLTVRLWPAEAQELLERNTLNRNLSRLHVHRLAQDMRAGNWDDNGQPIGFDTDGVLVDGQHRLNAAIIAGIPITFDINVGLSPQSRGSIDQNRPRRAKDLFFMRGERHAMGLAAVTRNLFLFSQNGIITGQGGNTHTKGDKRLTTIAALDQFLATHPYVRRSTEFVYSRKWKNMVPTAILGALHYLFAHASSERKANEFMEQLHTGAGMDSTDPLYMARERFLESVTATVGKKLNVRYKSGLLIKAWNMRLKGRTVQYLKLSRNENYPTIGGLDMEAFRNGDWEAPLPLGLTTIPMA